MIDTKAKTYVQVVGRDTYYVHMHLIERLSGNKDDHNQNEVAKEFAKVVESKKNLTEIDAETASTIKSQKLPGYYKFRSGPYSYQAYKKFVSNITGDIVQLVRGKVGWAFNDNAGWILVSAYPDCMLSVEVVKVSWKSGFIG